MRHASAIVAKRTLTAMGSLLLLSCSGDGGTTSAGGTVNFDLYSTPLQRSLAKNGAGVIVAKGDRVVAGGFFSLDHAATWKQFNPQLLGVLRPTWLSDNSLLMISGKLGLAKYTFSDDTVRAVTPPPSVDITEFMVRSDDTVVIADFIGNKLVVGPNAGSSWTSKSFPASVHCSSAAIAEPHATYIYCDSGLISTTDDGATWTMGTKAPNASGAYKVMAGPDAVYLTDHNSALQTSIDQGSTWIARPLPPTSNLTSVQVSRDGTVYTPFDQSTDRGATWTPIFDSSALHIPYATENAASLTEDGVWIGLRDNTDVGGEFFFSPKGSGELQFVEGFDAAEKAQNPIAFANASPGVVSGTQLLQPEIRFDADRKLWVRSAGVGAISDLHHGRIASFTGPEFSTSVDQGRTWSAPVNVISANDIPDYLFNDAKGVYVDASGALLAITRWARQYSANNPSDHITVIHMSHDDGKTWAYFTRISDPALGEVLGIDGVTLVAQGGNSYDQGKTWVKPAKLSVDTVRVGIFPTGGTLVVHKTETSAELLREQVIDGSTTALGSIELLDTASPADIGYQGMRLGTIAIDDSGYVYIGCGDPLLTVCRSTRPLN